jgi:hypothetical protein
MPPTNDVIGGSPSHEPTPDDPTIAAAGELSQAADSLSNHIEGLRQQMTKNRRQFRRALLSLVVAVVIVAGFAVFSYQTATTARSAASRSATNQQVAYNSCVNTDQSRANDKRLWTAVIQGFVHPTNSSQTSAAIAHIEGLVNITFAPKDCGTP